MFLLRYTSVFYAVVGAAAVMVAAGCSETPPAVADAGGPPSDVGAMRDVADGTGALDTGAADIGLTGVDLAPEATADVPTGRPDIGPVQCGPVPDGVCINPPCDCDGDGVNGPSCPVAGRPTDCDDQDCRAYPGNTAGEECDADGVDNDCNPCTLGRDRDRDMDGYPSSRCFNRFTRAPANGCAPSERVVVNTAAREVRGTDCEDDPMRMGAQINPGITEECDGHDNDCSGRPDDGTGMDCVFGAQPRSCSDSACGGSAGQQTCNRACQWVGTRGTAECVRTGGRACAPMASQMCTAPGHTGLCGTQQCNADCGGHSACEFPPEQCNYRDDDCNGRIDEGESTARACRQTWGDVDNPATPPAGALPFRPADFILFPGTQVNAAGELVLLSNLAEAYGRATLSRPVRRAHTMELEALVHLGGDCNTTTNDQRGSAFALLLSAALPPNQPAPSFPIDSGVTGLAVVVDTGRFLVNVHAFRNGAITTLLNSVIPMSPAAGDGGLGELWCAGAGYNLTNGLCAPGGVNNVQLRLTGSQMVVAVRYDSSNACLNASVTDPLFAEMLGQNMYVSVSAISNLGSHMHARVRSLTLRRSRPADGQGGGPCAGEAYCP